MSDFDVNVYVPGSVRVEHHHTVVVKHTVSPAILQTIIVVVVIVCATAVYLVKGGVH
jgi:hypothetical protein